MNFLQVVPREIRCWRAGDTVALKHYRLRLECSDSKSAVTALDLAIVRPNWARLRDVIKCDQNSLVRSLPAPAGAGWDDMPIPTSDDLAAKGLNARSPDLRGRAFACLHSTIRGLFGVHRVLTDWQRNGGAQDVVGIVVPFGRTTSAASRLSSASPKRPISEP